MPQSTQLSLDTLIEKRRSLPDGWVGNVFRHYGELYGIKIIGFDPKVCKPGTLYSVVHGKVKEDEVSEG